MSYIYGSLAWLTIYIMIVHSYRFSGWDGKAIPIEREEAIADLHPL